MSEATRDAWLEGIVHRPEALLFRVASNAVYEWRLLARNRLPHGPTELEDLESGDREPSADIWRAELARALTAALERLSPKCRAAVLLHRREQLTYSEVGAMLGISVAMVKRAVWCLVPTTLRASGTPRSE